MQRLLLIILVFCWSSNSIGAESIDARLSRIEERLARIETLLATRSSEEQQLMDLYKDYLNREFEALEQELIREDSSANELKQRPPSSGSSQTVSPHLSDEGDLVSQYLAAIKREDESN